MLVPQALQAHPADRSFNPSPTLSFVYCSIVTATHRRVPTIIFDHTISQGCDSVAGESKANLGDGIDELRDLEKIFGGESVKCLIGGCR